MKNPQTMSFPEIIREIQTTRGEVRDKGRRIRELSAILQDRVRKQGADEYTPRYLAFVSAQTRFVGALEQGVQRVASADRSVVTIEREQREAEENKKKEQPKPEKKVRYATTAPLADLAELFGQEMIDDASR